jgi:ribosomal protein S18 acetylase RimI-like enzyme
MPNKSPVKPEAGDMKIRKATATDSRLLSSLCVDVQTLHAQHHPDFFKMPQSDDFAVSFYDEMLADPSVAVYIAEGDTQALGFIFCKLLDRPENPFAYANHFLQIEHISVRPEAQQHGVGTALMNRAGELAREIGVTKIQLDSWDFNIKAHTFFEKLDFEKFDYRFWRKLY